MGDMHDSLINRIETWTDEVLNDTDKLSIWKAYGAHRIPSEKEIALDELFGVK
jgi:hypothetical protein